MTPQPRIERGDYPARTGASHGLNVWLRLSAAVAELNPAYFALVMATGIVSIAAEQFGWRGISVALLALNVLCFAVLWGLTAWRIARFPKNVRGDLLHHGRCMGFLTMVAATNVLGSQFLVVYTAPIVAMTLWGLGLALWAILIYGLFTTLVVKSVKPSLEAGINGGWLVAVVATQSVTVLGVPLSAHLPSVREEMLFFSLGMWLSGAVLYSWIIALIFFRYMFFHLDPSDLAPPYWINMGAMAISTLAAANLIQHADGSPVLRELVPFLKGGALTFWATATWWVPMLLILGAWRHGVRRFPLRYDPLYWGAVFPLGMYSTCTLQLTGCIEAPFLVNVAYASLWVAVAAWSLTFVGLAWTIVSGVIGRPKTLGAT